MFSNFFFNEQKFVGGNSSGVVIVLAGSIVPDGYIECNGSLLSREVYEDLFAHVGETYGAGDGTTTFRIPDLRGEFIRGFDNGKGSDAGRLIGSNQTEDNKAHGHTFAGSAYGGHTHSLGGTSGSGGGHSHTITAGWKADGGSERLSHRAQSSTGTFTTSSVGNHTHSVSGTANKGGAFTPAGTIANAGSESRPRNIAMMYCIKY